MTDPADRSTLRGDHVGQLASLLAASGFPRLPASVMMALMVSEHAALTADELGAEVAASPAAISGAMKFLSTVGMVTRHRLPGERRFVYELPVGPWYTASLTKSDLYTRIADLADQALPQLEGAPRERMAELASFFRFLERRMPALLDEWRATRPEE